MGTLEARGVELAWESLGEGPAVVLVHDSTTTSGAWREFAERLARGGARAVLYDRRGFGASSAPDGYRRTTIEEQSEDLGELVAAVGPPAVLIGAGTGAAIALDLMLRRPELVSGALLIEPHLPGLVPAATERLSDDRAALIEALNEGGREQVLDRYLAGELPGLGPGAERLPEELKAPVRERPEGPLAELGAGAAWAMPLHRLASSERPARVLLGSDVPSLLEDAGRALAERLAACELERLTEAGPPHLSAPERCAASAIALGGS